MNASNLEQSFDHLSNEAQQAANAAIDGLQGLLNHGFDAGEPAVGDLLRVADTLQSQLSTLLSQVTNKAADKLGG